MLAGVEPDEETTAEELDREVGFLSAERLAVFSDAVVAIAITLLALDLPIPHGQNNMDLLRSVADNRDEYLAFAISFIVIAAHWRGHHRTFSYLRAAGPIVGWNLLWLFFIVLTPFSTRVLSDNGAFQVRFTFYAAQQALIGISFLMVIIGIDRHKLLRPGSPPDLLRTGVIRLIGLSATFLISIPVCFFTPWAYAIWVAIPLTSRIVRRVADLRRPAPA
jgi:TMEM175 potassium channel family protein